MNKEFSEIEQHPDRPRADKVSGNGQASTASSGNASRAILLIDDNPAVTRAMEIAFRLADHVLDIAVGPEEAYSLLARRRFDAILLDLNFTPGKADGREGLACLARIMTEDPAACVVVVTAHGGIRTAVAAMQAGARDFAVKPWKNADLIQKVEDAIAREPIVSGGASAAQSASGGASPRLLGESGEIIALRNLIQRVGPTAAGVTITGPPGVGRQLTARALYAASGDADAGVLRIDLRDDSAWAQLERASGTVILRHPDRLEDIAQDRLAELLPATIRPIAIADSLANLTPALRRRIATVELAVPPLAQRREDISLLARHFLRDAAERFGRPVPQLTGSAEDALRVADWPDEVRGLALTLERAVLLAEDGVVDAAALSLGASPKPEMQQQVGETERNFDLNQSEKSMIKAALAEHHQNVSHAARALGLSRGALYRRMERYGL
ncbi:sigma-54-dependent transcriptional regulator [Novosphingopyxis sp.]|uniref:sigma-54-dependent transcriptional regulator n=1 Tax=Novosphingopyxis sp. TaxID=2709690 RepID=UPI003B5BACBC